MKLVVHHAAALLALALGACATPSKELVSAGRATLDARALVSIDTLQYAPLPLGEMTKAEFDDKSPAVEVSGRRSYVRGFALPKVEGQLAINVSSFRFGPENDPAIMYPDIRLLDETYRVVEVVPASRFVYRTTRRGDGLSADIFIDVGTSSARYLLLMEHLLDEADQATAQTNVTSQMQMTLPVKGGFMMWFLPTGNSTLPVRLRSAPTGRVELTADRYQLRKIPTTN